MQRHKPKRILVVECGGSGSRRAVVSGRKVGDISIWRGSKSVEGLVAFVLNALDEIDNEDVMAVSLSIAGVIKDHQEVVTSPNIPWLDGVDIAEEIRVAQLKHGTSTIKPCVVGNDMETAAIGMAKLFPDLKYFAAITWSSGIGVRIVMNGRVLSDSEAGHIQIDNSPFAPICGCGKRGCAEAILGTDPIVDQVLSWARIHNQPVPPKTHPCAWLDQLYRNEEPFAVRIYNEVIIPGMARFLTDLQTIFCLPAIVWKGGFALNSLRIPGVEQRIRQEMNHMIIDPLWTEKLKFYFCEKKDEDSFVGASVLAKHLLNL